MTHPPADPLLDRATKLGLFGLVARWDELRDAPWLPSLLDAEELERKKRSLERRLAAARLGRFQAMADFDWSWPKKVDREQIEDLFTLRWIGEAMNVVLVGPNGVGKTMIAKNLAHQAVLRGHTVLFVRAGEMLNDLAAQDGPLALQRRLRRYGGPSLLCIDELGYLSYDDRHADLLFEVITRRYGQKSILLTTNKPFADWPQVFPNAASVVTLVDRLVHHAEIVNVDGGSYRRKEAQENAAGRAKEREGRRAGRRGAVDATATAAP
jgi:DNA replication protein DnaC